MVQREDDDAPAKRRREPNGNAAMETPVKPPHSGAGYASEPSGAGPQLLHGAKTCAAEALLPEAPGASTARGFDGLRCRSPCPHTDGSDPAVRPGRSGPSPASNSGQKIANTGKTQVAPGGCFALSLKRTCPSRSRWVHSSNRPTKMTATRYFPLGGRLFIGRPFVASGT
jgi:hypothetical protein